MEDGDGVMNEIKEKAGGSKEAGWIVGKYSKELRRNNSEEKGSG